MTEPLEALQQQLPYSLVLKPVTGQNNLYLVGGVGYFIDLSDGVSNVLITWNGTTPLNVFHRPHRSVRLRMIDRIPATDYGTPLVTRVTVGSEDGRGQMLLTTSVNPEDVDQDDVRAYVQVFPVLPKPAAP